jgi:hypothetical protein
MTLVQVRAYRPFFCHRFISTFLQDGGGPKPTEQHVDEVQAFLQVHTVNPRHFAIQYIYIFRTLKWLLPNILSGVDRLLRNWTLQQKLWRG